MTCLGKLLILNKFYLCGDIHHAGFRNGKMKIGQFIVSMKDGSKYQIRRLRCFNGVGQIGIGRKGICWINVEDFEIYKKVKG